MAIWLSCSHQHPRRRPGERTLPSPGSTHRSEPISDLCVHLLTFPTGVVWRYLWSFTEKRGHTFRTTRNSRIGVYIAESVTRAGVLTQEKGSSRRSGRSRTTNHCCSLPNALRSPLDTRDQNGVAGPQDRSRVSRRLPLVFLSNTSKRRTVMKTRAPMIRQRLGGLERGLESANVIH
jgi:hypothetical protein